MTSKKANMEMRWGRGYISPDQALSSPLEKRRVRDGRRGNREQGLSIMVLDGIFECQSLDNSIRKTLPNSTKSKRAVSLDDSLRFESVCF